MAPGITTSEPGPSSCTSSAGPPILLDCSNSATKYSDVRLEVGGDNDILVQATTAILAGLYSAGDATQGLVDSLLCLRWTF